MFVHDRRHRLAVKYSFSYDLPKPARAVTVASCTDSCQLGVPLTDLSRRASQGLFKRVTTYGCLMYVHCMMLAQVLAR